MLIKPINPIAKMLRDRKYKPQVIPDKTKYNRKKVNEKYNKSKIIK